MKIKKKHSIQVPPSHYIDSQYDTKERFSSYWYQIKEVNNLKPSKLLEIGVGNKFISNYLNQRHYNISTLDIDKRLKPSKVGSVTKIPYQSGSFDLVLCFQILEHLPFSDFRVALKEIFRVSSRNVILSLPDSTLSYRIYFHVPFYKVIQKVISVPIFPMDHIYSGQHYWEIGKKNFSLSRIVGAIEDEKFKIINHYRVFDNPFHHFFILEK